MATENPKLVSESSNNNKLKKLKDDGINTQSKRLLSDHEDKSSCRERLKRHRVEMAGRVWIPDLWGQEAFLKDWVDCTAFDAAVRNNGMMTAARASLVEQPNPPCS